MKKIGRDPVKKHMRKKFPTLKPGDSIARAVKVFKGTTLSAIPVLSNGNFVGELHESDLLKLAVDPTRVSEAKVARSGLAFFAEKVSELMTRHEDTIAPDALVSEAALMMLNDGDAIVPVTEGGKIVGVITRQDIVNRMVK
ncbi:MAG: CBS domain-containing protein [Candidatus Diapherotrites archaeon]|nr:CBS domain-containing protein [Candidatus Diapherotrites archaeon]